MGTIDLTVFPDPKKGTSSQIQMLRAQLVCKSDEINALKASHSVARDQLHLTYKLEHARLEIEG